MRGTISIFTTLTRIFAVTLLSGGLILEAQAPAGPHRPPQVPENYVITPFGYFHPSCVIHLAKGDTLMEGGRVIQKADGSTLTPVCNYPHYTARGEKIAAGAANAQPPTIGHSWIASESTTTSTSYGEISSDWYVPSTPFSNDGQTLFFFPGLQDTNVVSILQPVLGWNADFSDGWGIASWNCCISGIADESSAVRVSTGDIIAGTIQSTCGDGTLSCPSWNISTEDGNTGATTTLSDTPSEGQTFNWAFGGVLEVYNLVQCSDYPPEEYSTFYTALYDNDFNIIASPSWSFTNWASGLTPQCDYSGQVGSTGAITLGYGNYGGPSWSFSAGIPQGNSCQGPGSFSFSLKQQYNANSLKWVAADSTNNTEVISFDWTMSDNDGVLASGGADGSYNLSRAPVGTPTLSVNGSVLQTLTGCDAQFSEDVTATN